jgi:hypothetical protein
MSRSLVRAAPSESGGIIALMDPALASLLGAIVGGLIASGSNVGLDMIRARRERAGAEAREHRDARRAARLIVEELESARRLLASSVDANHRTWRPHERQLPAASWARYSTDFALVASDDQWDAASSAYAIFDALNWHIRAVIEEEHWTGEAQQHPMSPPPALGPETAKMMQEALGKIDRALDELRLMMEGSGVATTAAAPPGRIGARD